MHFDRDRLMIVSVTRNMYQVSHGGLNMTIKVFSFFFFPPKIILFHSQPFDSKPSSTNTCITI